MNKKVTMYKLVSQNMTTHGGMKWEIGKTNKALGIGTEMCSNQVLHCYRSPEEAVLFNPIHAGIQNPVLFEIECSEIVNNDGLKYASKEQTPKRIAILPVFTLSQKVAFAIKMALSVYKEPAFVKWADAWLCGSDRTTYAAHYANAANAATTYAANAANYAARAAHYANAANAAATTYAAHYANAANAAATTYAANYAARAAHYANAANAANYAAFGDLLRATIDWVINSFEG